MGTNKKTVEMIDNFANQSIKIMSEALAEKDQIISKLQEKTKERNNPTNEQLLRILGKRIAKWEIKKTYFKGFPYLGVWEEKTGKRVIELCLTTGKIEPEDKEATHV